MNNKSTALGRLRSSGIVKAIKNNAGVFVYLPALFIMTLFIFTLLGEIEKLNVRTSELVDDLVESRSLNAKLNKAIKHRHTSNETSK